MEPKTHKTAVVIIPPAAAWAPIQAIRREHDRHFRRWMPHITLLYPFRPKDHFPALQPLFRQALRAVRPFTVQLSEFRYFTHGRHSTLWLFPDPAAPLLDLQRILQSLTPDCHDVARFPQGFTPHLSLGQAHHPRHRDALITALQKAWQPLSFPVASIHLIARNDPPDDVFQIVSTIPLGE